MAVAVALVAVLLAGAGVGVGAVAVITAAAVAAGVAVAVAVAVELRPCTTLQKLSHFSPYIPNIVAPFHLQNSHQPVALAAAFFDCDLPLLPTPQSHPSFSSPQSGRPSLLPCVSCLSTAVAAVAPAAAAAASSPPPAVAVATAAAAAAAVTK